MSLQLMGGELKAKDSPYYSEECDQIRRLAHDSCNTTLKYLKHLPLS